MPQIMQFDAGSSPYRGSKPGNGTEQAMQQKKDKEWFKTVEVAHKPSKEYEKTGKLESVHEASKKEEVRMVGLARGHWCLFGGKAASID